MSLSLYTFTLSILPNKTANIIKTKPICNAPISKSNKSSAVVEMGDRLATIDMGQKVGVCAPFLGGATGPHLTQCGLGRGLPLYQVAS